MPAAAIVGGSVLLGGAIQSNAASKAARAQTKAANQSIAFQRESRDIALELQRPQREAGYAATAALMDLTGLPRGTPSSSRPPVTIDGSTGEVMPKMNGILGYALRSASGGSGASATNTAGSSATTAPNLADFPAYKFQADPGYQFRLDEGNKALERGAAARGGLLSGGFARKAIRYAQDYASNEYQNVYNRIAAIAGFGQAAASQGAGIVVNTGTNVGNAMVNAGEARASGYIAQGNAWSNALDQFSGAYGKGMFGGSGGGGGSGSLWKDPSGSGFVYNIP